MATAVPTAALPTPGRAGPAPPRAPLRADPSYLPQLHAALIKSGELTGSAKSFHSLLEAAAASPTLLPYAVSLFRLGPRPPLSTPCYNVLMRAFLHAGHPEDALHLFIEMLHAASACPADQHTAACALKSCSRMCALDVGRGVQAYAVKRGLVADRFVLSSLIHMYASCGDVAAARLVFDAAEESGVVMWNAIVAAYLKNGDWMEVVEMFKGMLEVGVAFDEVTLVSVVTACGRIGDAKLGKWVAGHVDEEGLARNPKLVTALMDMYAKCGEIGKARRLFDGMQSRDVVAWSAMISGYTQADQCREALGLFSEMQLARVEPNDVTMVSVLSACAVLGALETGKWVHSYVRRKRLSLTTILGTALVDFYAKCGCIDDAVEAFESMPVKNSWTWTALIKGMATNGRGREALELFSSMREAGIEPTDVTFIGVLMACSHSCLVEEGRRHFDSMARDYGIKPRVEHYGCMVDLLGRAGLVDEAYQFIRTMPIEPNAVIWRALLSSCAVHRNVGIGEEALKQIISLNPSHSGDYVLLSNIYASAGQWKDAAMVRKEMKDRGIEKTPGCSLIELDGVVFEFFAEDSDHPELREIYQKVEEMIGRIKVAGYVPNTADVRLEVEEREKEVSVSHHSEKLAIAFGLMKLDPGATIRLSKNLRVCADCHSATKLISKVYDREIVVRDRNIFHHFKDGTCSCNDYW
ncbi:pentatricopeptide repeat-containing protein At1g08070, chloroplastic [Zea mays]|uniref:Pentatricopeptide repeat-containing protein chloroplastic n=1 Tax=Zea mays TaxID=4577 RepID=K7TU74_MAIZE|nr:pentatricopeptide repeat-containing protein At1g08070, chloroplastic [Zea mays]AQK44279.1 Pentatricopeptide repeat-containing protein chloroplastic [Zea mays]|eukprot:XP_008663321.1 pentatricopeptide repeat-containing protein At1g08070, chloroplastic [Zea mays]